MRTSTRKGDPAPKPVPRRGKPTWQQKLENDRDLPKVVVLAGKRAVTWGQGTCAIPAPREIDALMKTVPRGKVTTIQELRAAVARRHHADVGCPLTTGIFSWIAAHAAEEMAAAGQRKITPYWRTLKVGGELNPKYPGGIAAIRARLEAEGHRVIQRGKRFFVEDYARCLVRPS